LLLLFGTRWLRKAILRAAGIVALHDEEKIFASETRALSEASRTRAPGADRGSAPQNLDVLGFLTSLKGVFIEGLEVVFIVIAVGATGGLLLPASAGALCAGIVVLLLGLALHRPLARVPENVLKFAVGVLLSSFGVFWIGEGLAFPWPGGDWAIPAIVAAFLLIALWAVRLARGRVRIEVFAAQ
jgi:uncharacterized membrane protein